MDADAWIARFAAELGLPEPTAAETEAILALAGVAAHSSERRAAPVACWLAARADIGLDEAQALARRLAAGEAQG